MQADILTKGMGTRDRKINRRGNGARAAARAAAVLLACAAMALFAVPTQATVSSTTTQLLYTCNGTDTVFPYTFKIFSSSDLYVATVASTGVETQLTTGFSVSGAGSASGGNVTFSTAPASGTTLLLRRQTVQHQEIDLVPNARLNSETLESGYDKLTMIAQDQQNQLDRCVKFSSGTSAGSKIPLPEPEAYSYLMWNADGTALVNTSTGFDSVNADFTSITTTVLNGVTLSSFGASWLDESSASTARSTLGLGAMALQDASGVAVTGGSIDVPTLKSNGNGVIAGDSTSGRVLRQMWLYIENGSASNTIKVYADAMFNGDSITTVDSMAKGYTGTSFDLSANGSHLRIHNAALSGNCVMVQPNLAWNSSGTALTVYGSDSINLNDITLAFQHASTGAEQDLTTLVDTGVVYLQLLYMTDN